MASQDPVEKPLNTVENDAEAGEQPTDPVLIKTDPTTASDGKPPAKTSGVQIQDPPVSERRGYTIVKVEEKHGPLHSAIPVMPIPLAVLCCILNVVLPGTGTLTSAFTVFCCGTTRIAKPVHAFGLNIASALLQMITFFIIVGWIWSILWGMTFVQLCLSAQEARMPSIVPYYVRRQSSVE